MGLCLIKNLLLDAPLHLMGPMMVSAVGAAKVDMAVQLDHSESMNIIRVAVEAATYGTNVSTMRYRLYR
jgi:hypothetical protein